VNEPTKAGLSDPEQWIDWWLELHASDNFHGHLARLALSRLQDDEVTGETRFERLTWQEDDELFEVEVSYLVEEYTGRGRVFHILSIRSDGDPLPPWIRD
jgi:hypothetical protein